MLVYLALVHVVIAWSYCQECGWKQSWHGRALGCRTETELCALNQLKRGLSRHERTTAFQVLKPKFKSEHQLQSVRILQPSHVGSQYFKGISRYERVRRISGASGERYQGPHPGCGDLRASLSRLLVGYWCGPDEDRGDTQHLHRSLGHTEWRWPHRQSQTCMRVYSWCICIYLCIYIYMDIYIYIHLTCICHYMSIYIYIHIHMHTRTRTHTQIYIYIYYNIYIL